MARVVLHGALKEKFNPEYNLSVQSAGEAIKALSFMVPGFKDAIMEGSYFVYAEDEEHINIDEDNFHLAVPGSIHIMPEVVGAKKKGLGKILLGVAMIGLTFAGAGMFAFQAASAAGMGVGAAATVANISTYALMNVGIALTLGGATQLLSPKIKNSPDAEKDASGILQGQETTLANGSAVPLIYGEILAVGVPVSFEVSDATSNYVTNDPGYNSSVGGWDHIAIPVRDFLIS